MTFQKLNRKQTREMAEALLVEWKNKGNQVKVCKARKGKSLTFNNKNVKVLVKG